MNSRLQFHNLQILVRLVSIYCSLACLSFSSLAQEEQEAELITGKQFPDGFGVERSSLSPDKRYGVLAPDSDHYDWKQHQNKLVEVNTGRTLAVINAETGVAGFHNHGGIEPSRWSADGSLLLWEVDGKWAPRALVLLKIEDGKIKWQHNLLQMAQQAILTRTRKFSAEGLRGDRVDSRCSSHRRRRCAALTAGSCSRRARLEPQPCVGAAAKQRLCPFRDGGYRRF